MAARVGGPALPEGVGSRVGRRWSPELLSLGPAPDACACRICGKPIALAEASWGWRWRSTERGHLGCGWYVLSDVDAPHALRSLLRRSTDDSRTRAHELFLVKREGGKWNWTPIGVALLRLIRASEATPTSVSSASPPCPVADGGAASEARTPEGK